MVGTRYRRKGRHTPEMEAYVRNMAEDNSAQHSRLKRNLVQAMNEDITPRQRQCLTMYYVEGMNMPTIGANLGINKATVSRNIRRGEDRLRRCLKYGASELLNTTVGK